MLKRFLFDRRGNFAVMAAGVLIMLAIAIGGAVDVSMLSRDASAAQAAADAAALAGAKRMETGTASDATAMINSVATANLPDDLKSATIASAIDTANGLVSVTISGSYKTAFLSLAHTDALTYSRQSQSTIKRNGYMDFYFLLDVSESMNIAADATERAKLQATTKAANNRPCAFACHEVEPYWSPKSVYQMNQEAGANKAKLRIDVLQDAFDTTVDNLLAVNAKSDNLTIRISTAGFSSAFEKGLTASTNAVELKKSIRNFTVANGHTTYTLALQGLSDMMGDQADGSAQTKPEKVAVIITDGVKDEPSWTFGTINQGYCTALKDKGFKVAVLEIKYIYDLDYQGYFLSRVAPFYTSITPQLDACASPGLHYLATDSKQASEKLSSLANDLVRQNLRVEK
ncbi:pilus assembly protein [Aureimonas sp. AU40]|uniref:pilus assembly protein n=1 Tax=Aureimonas sp. AU40 TaxID=1637747 RepID=UPI0007842619|nr:pilus assembly protein TadG-related protein [Aureimonas sp. AU40]